MAVDLLERFLEPFPVLDQGFVRFVDCMPRNVAEGETVDAAIVRAARVSYGEGTKRVSGDRGLIRYLMRHRHTSPFEMAEFTFHVKCPIFVARQWMRHRTGSFNEVSARYSVLPEEFYVAEPHDVQRQSLLNRQGRDGAFEKGEANDILFAMRSRMAQTHAEYHHLLGKDLSRELARTVLPVATYTEFYWKVDLLNLLKFLHLRTHKHAQLEIAVYGMAISGVLSWLAPHTMEAYQDYWVEAPGLSSGMWTAVLRTIRESDRKAMVDVFKAGESNRREVREFAEMLGVDIDEE